MPQTDTSTAPTLRQDLRNATTEDHDRLDGMVTALDFEKPGNYLRFLTMQLVARRPIERWLAEQSLPFGPPPPMATLVAADMAQLGDVPQGEAPFSPPPGSAAIGACWAIAGSSLGNRAIHRELQRTSPELPLTFLGDQSTTAYWQSIRPSLEAPADETDAEAAIACARAVFATFLFAAERCLRPRMAS